MKSLHNTIQVDASPEQAWAVIGDLASVTAWIPGVSQAKIDGLQRICTFENGMVQHESISNFSPDTFSYDYAIDSGGLPLKSNRGSFRVDSDNGNTQIVWDSRLEFVDAAQEANLLPMIEQAYQQCAVLLKQTIEDRV